MCLSAYRDHRTHKFARCAPRRHNEVGRGCLGLRRVRHGRLSRLVGGERGCASAFARRLACRPRGLSCLRRRLLLKLLRQLLRVLAEIFQWVGEDLHVAVHLPRRERHPIDAARHKQSSHLRIMPLREKLLDALAEAATTGARRYTRLVSRRAITDRRQHCPTRGGGDGEGFGSSHVHARTQGHRGGVQPQSESHVLEARAGQDRDSVGEIDLYFVMRH